MRNAFLAMEFTTTREVLASLYEQTPTATLLCDRDGQIVAANPAAQQLTGREDEQLLGHVCEELFAGGTQAGSCVARALSGERAHFDAELTRLGAPPLRVECDAFPARLGGTVTAGFLQMRPARGASADEVTGLPDRLLLNDRIEQCIAMTRRYRHSFALMHVRTERAGEPTEIAERIRSLLRESDTLARLDGVTFAVLQPMIDDAEDAADLARKVSLADVRVGVALFPADGESADELHAAAQRDLDSQAATRRARERAT